MTGLKNQTKGKTGPLSRLERARAALAIAQEKTGVRQDPDRISALVGAWSVTPASTATALRKILSQGGWAAVVALPDIGWLHLAESGVPLERVIAIPNPGQALPEILSACVDSVECTLCGHLEIPASKCSALAAKVAANRRFFLWVEDRPCLARPFPEREFLSREGEESIRRIG